MKADELAFLNRQLAGMLRDGIPLEGALRGAAREMKSGRLRAEMESLERDLASGTPLGEAAGRRAFPAVYRKLLQAGAAGGDLPGALLAAADHFESVSTFRRRLQATMVYPSLVLAVLALLSVLVLRGSRALAADAADHILGPGALPPSFGYAAWIMPATVGLLALAWVGLVAIPGVRSALAWRLPLFRDALVARAAGTLAALVRQGCPLPDAVAFLREVESGTPLGREMATWERRLASGERRFAEVAAPDAGRSVFPPLFRWMVSQSGERVGDGLEAAGRYFADRSRHRADLFLHGAMPVSMLLVGLLVVLQFAPLILAMVRWIDGLGGIGP